MRPRLMFALWLGLLSSAVAAAGPLELSYSLRLSAASGERYILLGNETWWEYDPEAGSEKGTDYLLLLDVGNGWTRTGTVTTGTPEEPFGFGNGDWSLHTDLPTTGEGVSDHQFKLELQLTDPRGNVATLAPQLGSLSAGGLTTGTGNFTIGLEGSQVVQLGDKRAKVTFDNRESESANRITFLVEDVTPPDVPEPASLILGGIALAAGGGAWLRRWRKG